MRKTIVSLVADTDGDGFDDGAEVAAGTDPLDPNVFPSEAVPVPVAGGFALLGLFAALLAAGRRTLSAKSD
jgi:hypothetical protein